ncbi:MAG: hypothetical protein GXP22_07780 [Gammaproteobacteria bacterium]|nr:hypothetical protein [Gammaproteobacteria bacterium]
MKKGILFVIALGLAPLSQADDSVASPYNQAIAFDSEVVVSQVSLPPLSKPVPPIIWSFGLGMVGLLALAKCRKSV